MVFGRSSPGQSRHQILKLNTKPGTVECALEAITFASGSSSSFEVSNEWPVPATIAAGEELIVVLTYSPGAFGAHFGRVAPTVDDPHAPMVEARLFGEATASGITTDEALVRFGSLTVGVQTSASICIRNEGPDEVAVLSVSLDWRTDTAVLLDPPLPSGAPLGREMTVCVNAVIRPDVPGPHGGALIFELDDGGLPLVVLLMGEAAE